MGPLLFLIFINDLVEIFDPAVTPKLYADDVKLYTKIESNVDNERLQQNVDRMVQWAKTWQLNISINKCQTMHISKKRDRCLWKTTFHIDSNPLPDCDFVRDLGVEVDCDLKFSLHINHIVRKASIRSYLLSRSFVSRDTQTLVRAFKVYVRPILEYCSVVWSPYLAKDVDLLESVQRKFTKYLPGLRSMSYSDRLKRVGLERLDVRRLRYDLIVAYKILFGLIPIDSTQFLYS